ncbi:MAG: cytoplasmic protein [Deltaproteobacteria bacterium]|nr:cytoplasmic protein [Deltaproteobacteria bacterium]
MNKTDSKIEIDFSFDKKNLYKEEAFSDRKVGVIRKLTPVNMDGTEDKTRKTDFFGHIQIMSPEGPVPIQAPLKAKSLEEAVDLFPEAMQRTFHQMVEQETKRQQKLQIMRDEYSAGIKDS